MAVEGGKKEQDLVITNFFMFEAKKIARSSGNDSRSYFKKPLGSRNARSQIRK